VLLFCDGVLTHVTVSAKIDRELREKLRRYGISISKVVKRALEASSRTFSGFSTKQRVTIINAEPNDSSGNGSFPPEALTTVIPRLLANSNTLPEMSTPYSIPKASAKRPVPTPISRGGLFKLRHKDARLFKFKGGSSKGRVKPCVISFNKSVKDMDYA
jgi:post-segregation antitoxin (ccd killing protein)